MVLGTKRCSLEGAIVEVVMDATVNSTTRNNGQRIGVATAHRHLCPNSVTRRSYVFPFRL